MEPNRDNLDLMVTLQMLRPSLRPEFAAELDARAAAGFPRDPHSWKSRLARLGNRLRETPPRRILAPAGAVAAAAIVIASAVVVTFEGDPMTSSAPETRFSASPPVQYSASPPVQGAGESSAVSPSKGSVGASDSSGVQLQISPTAGSGSYASRAGRRDIERSAQMVLGADPADVRVGAAEVFDAVHAADGIVLSSSIRDGAEGEAGADFDLLIPSAKLGNALAAFSSIAEVRSRHESTLDITAPTVSVGERLQDSQARIESLLGQLADAGTDTERAAVEAELRAERRHASALRSRLAELRRRANFSRVSLRIETGAPSTAEAERGAWGIDDGLDGAGRILAVAAGVTVIALAILSPLALIALLAWLAHRTLVRRSRERVLD
jgi:uncharacterized protein DUF4349